MKGRIYRVNGDSTLRVSGRDDLILMAQGN